MTWSWRRQRVRGIEPLEVWHLPVGVATAQDLLGAPRVAALRAGGATDRTVAAWLAEHLEGLVRVLQSSEPRFERVVVGGGLANLAGLGDALGERLPTPPIHVADDPQWLGVRGGLALAAREGAEPCAIAVLDVGQTAIKVRALDGARFVVPRPWDRFPLTPHPAVDAAWARAQAVDAASWLGQTVGTASRGGGAEARCVVVGLPVALDDEGVPGDCTYAGWERLPDLVERMVRAGAASARDSPTTVIVANDAELAAIAAQEEAEDQADGAMLVLTLGHGPGAALLSAS